MPYANIDIFTFFSKTYSGLKLPPLGHCFINFVISYLVFLSSIYTGRGTTSFPGPLPWFGGGAGKGLFPPHPQARVKVLGTRLGGGTPLYGLYRYVRPQRVWFFGCFGHKQGINLRRFRSILAINRVWVLHSNLDTGIHLRRSHFFIIIEKKINKSSSQILFTVI